MPDRAADQKRAFASSFITQFGEPPCKGPAVHRLSALIHCANDGAIGKGLQQEAAFADPFPVFHFHKLRGPETKAPARRIEPFQVVIDQSHFRAALLATDGDYRDAQSLRRNRRSGRSRFQARSSTSFRADRTRALPGGKGER